MPLFYFLVIFCSMDLHLLRFNNIVAPTLPKTIPNNKVFFILPSVSSIRKNRQYSMVIFVNYFAGLSLS